MNRKSYLILLSVLLATTTAQAEMQFPAFEQLAAQDQAAWGYKVRRTNGRNPTLGVEIPAKASAQCNGARLYIRNKQDGLLAEFQILPIRQKDGSLTFSISLFEGLDGKGELIIYTDGVEGAPVTGDFGGFTFTIKVEKP